MDKKMYIILKTLNTENRIPTKTEIEMKEMTYKTLLHDMRNNGYIKSLKWNNLDVDKSHADITPKGIEFIIQNPETNNIE